MTKTQAPQQHQADHQTGTAYRDIKSGQQSVTERGTECQATGPGQPGQTVRPQPIAGQTGDQQVHHARQQTDVLPGNHQQVHGAGVLQHLPVFTAEPRAIPQHQRCQRSRSTLGIHCQQPLADAIAPGPPRLGQSLAVLDRTRRTNALRQ
ncbi:hypothetical protein D3C84_712530 [compost metagenome]